MKDYNWKNLKYADGQKAEQIELPSCFIDYHKCGEILFLTFEGAGELVSQIDGVRKPWGFDFLTKSGFSIFGFKPKNGRGWYRENDILEYVNSRDFQDICKRHKKCFFYGGSMGGYAALRFSEKIENSVVIALQPQVTLDRKIVTQERRFPESVDLDWSGLFSGGFPATHLAEQINVFYDPYLRPDRDQVDLISHSNLVRYRAPFLNHRVPSAMLELKLLKRSVLEIVEGHLTPNTFKLWMKERSSLVVWNLNIASRCRNLQRKKIFIERALMLDPKSHLANSAYCRFLLDHSPEKKDLEKVIKIAKTFPKFLTLAFTIEANAILNRAEAVKKDFYQFEVIFKSSRKKIYILKHAYRIISVMTEHRYFNEAERLVDTCIEYRTTCLYAKKLKTKIVQQRHKFYE